jgi:hypothetical protein
MFNDAHRWLLVALGAALTMPAMAADVEALLRQADAFRQPASSSQIDTLVATFRNGQPDKEKRYQVLIRAGGKSLVLFRSPGEIGQKVLMLGDDFWMLLPGSARPIRITPLQKLLGDASAGDIATMTWTGDYSGVVARELEVGGEPALELELTAKRPALSYQRIVLQVARRDARPLHADLYAVSNRKLKQARFEVEQRDGRRQVVRMILDDEVQTGRSTVVSFIASKPRELADAWFNPMFLNRADVAP